MKGFYFSKQPHLFGILIFFSLLGGFSLSAQQLLTEHISGTSDKSLNYQPHFDETSYTAVLDENGRKVFLKNQTASQNTPGQNATNGTLSIDLVFDASQFYVSSVLIFNESGYMRNANWNGTNPIVVNLPDGTYDIMTEFQPLNSDMSHIVIKEQQNVQGNTTVQLNKTDAVNYVDITTYDENGEILEPEAGAGGYIFFDRYLYFTPTNLVTIGDNYFETDPFGGADATWNFYINNVSNRYSIIQTLMGAGYEQGLYFKKYETLSGIQGPVSIENDEKDWSYHTELFQPTQLADSEIAPAYFAASTFNGNLLIGWLYSAGGQISPGDAPFRAFLSNPLDGDPVDFFVIPGIIDRFVINDPTTGGVSYFTKGNPVFSADNGQVQYGSGDLSFNSHQSMLDFIPFLGDDYYVMENNEIKLLPLHPRFTFDNTTTQSVVFGDNVPITVSDFKVNPNEFKIANKGRYGETRESDYLATQIEVKQNGSVIFSGTYEDFKDFNLPSNGQFEIVMINDNTLVDGLEGKNTTTITYNADEDDAPPTLQHLQFRDADDQVTSVLDSGQGATVRLAAGDFIYNPTGGDNGYYTYEEGNNVSLSYSLYNQNDWMELPLTEHPEYFQMPAFGDYYEASLEGIGNEDGNVWYDVKVICTDAGGNKQEQLISPAFKINEALSVQDITESSFAVYPNPFSEQLNFILPETVMGDYTFRVFDLTGRIIYANTQSDRSFSWNSSSLSEGVYILSIENNGGAITKKVIKL
ncbi:MAG TPA: T9SS type A sorting domain-containing protein [Aequorivita sp.]|nr:T9SS type A sorting domain-containing protein [Aequorivita sp.]